MRVCDCGSKPETQPFVWIGFFSGAIVFFVFQGTEYTLRRLVEIGFFLPGAYAGGK